MVAIINYKGSVMKIEKFSVGTGDRFGKQGKAQLQAFITAKESGIEVTPVWNKSHREHTTIGTSPDDVRVEADAAVKDLNWGGSYHVDADHIGLSNVDLFMNSGDFFTLDVADAIGGDVDQADVDAFVAKQSKYIGELAIPGIEEPFSITEDLIRKIATTYLGAVREAGKIYSKIEAAKGEGTFVTEVSMDETADPQTPVEMFFILAAIADEGIPAQTIAPKFSGRFNKGVDYVGDVDQFTLEFNQDLSVISFAITEFGLPSNLKLSVHSGSDKFSIYGPIGEAIKKHGAGLHLKTAGTTWLEELIGLAAAGGEGLVIAQEVYRNALGRFDELCGPYATVIDIKEENLPTADEVDQWSGEEYANALRHIQSCPAFNPDFRQLLHVAYKVAAEMGDRYLNALDTFEASVAANVTENILERHLKPLFAAM